MGLKWTNWCGRWGFRLYLGRVRVPSKLMGYYVPFLCKIFRHQWNKTLTQCQKALLRVMGFDKLWLQHEQSSQETEWNHSQFICASVRFSQTSVWKINRISTNTNLDGWLCWGQCLTTSLQFFSWVLKSKPYAECLCSLCIGVYCQASSWRKKMHNWEKLFFCQDQGIDLIKYINSVLLFTDVDSSV